MNINDKTMSDWLSLHGCPHISQSHDHRGSNEQNIYPVLTTATTNMAAANFVVITNGEGCALTETADIDQQRATCFLSASCDWLQIVAKNRPDLGGALIGGYMR